MAQSIQASESEIDQKRFPSIQTDRDKTTKRIKKIPLILKRKKNKCLQRQLRKIKGPHRRVSIPINQSTQDRAQVMLTRQMRTNQQRSRKSQKKLSTCFLRAAR
jgi:hypothetical protein